jgi:uncharacterized SAM-binding protein YcdF (DUF218 family)
MAKTYDTILLLAGEDTSHYYRSKKALELFKKGVAGNIFITGGFGGFARDDQELSDGQKSYLFMKSCYDEVPKNRIFIDEESRETLGNFVFPTVNPKQGNPRLEELESILVVTDESHMKRAMQLAKKVLPKEKLEFEASEGKYKRSLNEMIYHYSLMHMLKPAQEPSPHYAHSLLLRDHPFYKKGWFDKDISTRKVLLAFQCIDWMMSR